MPLDQNIRRQLEDVRKDFLSILYSTAKYKVRFATIKDNSSKTQFEKIDKVKTWVRRYSKTYWIMRGANNGTHWHIIMILKDVKKKITPIKGVHFNIKSVKSMATSKCSYLMKYMSLFDACSKLEVCEEIRKIVKRESPTCVRFARDTEDYDRLTGYMIKNAEENDSASYIYEISAMSK